MGIKLAMAVGLCCVTLQASAATVHDSAPMKKAAHSVRSKAVKPESAAAIDEYLQWHRESGYAVYASPLEAVAPDSASQNDSCAKAHAVPVN
jgi:hypothetical protein